MNSDNRKGPFSWCQPYLAVSAPDDLSVMRNAFSGSGASYFFDPSMFTLSHRRICPQRSESALHRPSRVTGAPFKRVRKTRRRSSSQENACPSSQGVHLYRVRLPALCQFCAIRLCNVLISRERWQGESQKKCLIILLLSPSWSEWGSGGRWLKSSRPDQG